ncbi:MAG: hypothetical protein ACO2YL_11750 [Paracoccaceae bacterium]|jgi:hypothetical protein
MQFAPYISFLPVMAALTLAAGQSTSPMTQELVRYHDVQNRLLDNDLVQFHVTLNGTKPSEQVARHAECAAAQYTLICGLGFALHVRTRIGQEADHLSADAVYTISRSLLQGTKTIEAEVVADARARDNIPMV